MAPKINYENLETEIGMSEAKLTEGEKDKDPDEVQSNALTSNTPRGALSSRRGSVDSSEGY